MKTGLVISLFVLLLAAVASPPSASGADDAKKKETARADIRKMEKETLSRLYKAQPKAQDAIAKAAGYAVFGNFGVKILVAGGGSGAAAQASSQGAAFAGAMSVAPGVWLYQLTDDGLALELTAKGTKYYKDGDLN